MLSLVNYRRADLPLAAAVILLVGVGCAIQFSLSGTAPTFFWRQVIAGILGIILAIGVAAIDYRAAYGWRRWLYFGTGGLLVGVLFFGTVIHGTRAWYQIFSVTFQPVEVAKLVLIIILAGYWIGRAREIYKPRYLVGSFLLIIPFMLLVLAQPDLGSALILFGIWFCLLFAIGPRLRHFAIIIGFLGVVAVLSWVLLLSSEQKERVHTFVNPRADPLGAGFQVLQATIAVGAGGVTGRGFGLGTQSQLHFLPAARTDFAFAAFAEEFGFLGVGAVMILFLIVFVRLLHIARSCRDDFGSLMIIGIAAMLGIETLVNIAMNLGLAPVVGIPLPFVSGGGSALVAHLVVIGLAESVVMYQPTS